MSDAAKHPWSNRGTRVNRATTEIEVCVGDTGAIDAVGKRSIFAAALALGK